MPSRLNRSIFPILLLFFLASCGLFKQNRLKNGQQHGYWITYSDDAKKNILTKGRFKNGVQVGKWTYYNLNGIKERKEVYRGKNIKIKHYHLNGKTALKGKAKIIVEEKKLHFYYYGPWYFYTNGGELQKISYYQNGTLVKEDYKIKSENQSYDSLSAELLQLNRDFLKYRDTLTKTNLKYGTKSKEYLAVWNLNQENDSLIYLRIENIIKRFGYPEKKYVGDNNSIIFYIISFAPYQVKEKYLDCFKQAAIKGEIALRDYAYFEDKYCLAKHGWQVYGTQFKTDKNYKQVFYPVKKLAELNDRRKSMNLEVVNLLEYPEIKD